MDPNHAGPSSSSPTAALVLLTSLPITHPSFFSLLTSLTPLTHPSSLPVGQLSKLLNRINTSILARDNEHERRAALIIAKEVVGMDEEGYVLMNWGKGWATTSLNVLTAASPTTATFLPALKLLSTLILTSSQYPSFERESVHPIMGKVGVTFSKLLEKIVSETTLDFPTLVAVMEETKTVLEHSPAPFRPLVPSLRYLLSSIILNIPFPLPSGPSTSSTPASPNAPLEVKQAAANLWASLHLTAGKAQSPIAWAGSIRDAIGGIAETMSNIVRDGWEEDAVKVVLPPAPASPALPTEPHLRLSACSDRLEGYTEEVLALLSYPTSRPVPVPIALLISAGLRCLNLTLDTPTVSYISPQQHASLVSALPRIWTCGLLLLSGTANVCGDHLLPHLSSILDHSTWLAERVPASMSQTHLQLLHFHHSLFSLYPPATYPIDYPTRLLRFCLSQYSSLLDSRPLPGGVSVNGGGGKRGKKRARGAEDGLIGGLEGRKQRALSQETIAVILSSMKLAELLHSTPLLSPTLLTFSMRLHSSIYLQIPTIQSDTFDSPADPANLHAAVEDVLEQAVLMNEGTNGTGRGWRPLILSVLGSTGEKLSNLLRPSLPPMSRPQPPLSALHYFAKETEEEKSLRRELGFAAADDVEAQDEKMDVDHEEYARPAGGQSQSIGRHSTNPTFPAPLAAIPQPALSSAISLPASQSHAAQVKTVSTTTTETIKIMPASSQSKSDSTRLAVPHAAPASTATSAVPSSDAAAAPAVPFMSTTSVKGKEKAVEMGEPRSLLVDDDDEPFPELDSGSSDGEEGSDEEGEQVEA